MKKNGGVLLICKETGNFLLGERAKNIPFPDCWSLFGGSVEEGESVLEGVKRELMEETQIPSDNIKYELFEVQTTFGDPYHFYLGYCDKEYECKLNDENQDWGWFDINNLPKPLFPTLYSSLVRIF
jgi:8-oxo-dGTP pyrophosphatase MutT (NUDIX family)